MSQVKEVADRAERIARSVSIDQTQPPRVNYTLVRKVAVAAMKDGFTDDDERADIAAFKKHVTMDAACSAVLDLALALPKALAKDKRYDASVTLPKTAEEMRAAMRKAMNDRAAAARSAPPAPAPDRDAALHISQPMTDYMNGTAWGVRHLAWHLSRQFDSVKNDKQTMGWLSRHGIELEAAAVQEGKPGNGTEFGAMHSAMIAILKGKFGAEFEALIGQWQRIPTDPSDANFPIPGPKVPYDPKKLADLNRVVDAQGKFNDAELKKFASPGGGGLDGFAIFVEEGIHNYTHNRFTDDKSKISMGDPTVNIYNKEFWALHGFIERALQYYIANYATDAEKKKYAADVALQKTMMETPPAATRGMVGMEGCSMDMGGVMRYREAIGDAGDPMPAKLHSFWSPRPAQQ